MNYATIAPLVLDGWFLLHQFFRLPTSADADNGAEQFQALQDLLASWENLGDDGWSGAYRIVGGGTDLLLVHFRRSLEALGEVEKRLQRHPGGSDLELTADYLSVVELSLYHLTATLAAQAEEQGVGPGSEEWRSMVEGQLSEELTKPHVQQRLHPAQPDELPYVCVYPMDKRRNEGQNWYRVPLEERAAMMRDHGVTGRRYAGRISQVISGSMGLDDWEWAVTLFGRSPNDFKEIVAEMRFDEVSAVYAEFGSFWVGYRVPTDRIREELSGQAGVERPVARSEGG